VPHTELLLPTVLELVHAHASEIGHVLVTGCFMAMLSDPNDRGEVWDAILDLPNLQGLSFDGFEAPSRTRGYI
jgi:hypothetical protein